MKMRHTVFKFHIKSNENQRHLSIITSNWKVKQKTEKKNNCLYILNNWKLNFEVFHALSKQYDVLFPFHNIPAQLDSLLGCDAIYSFAGRHLVCMYLSSKLDGITSQKSVILLILTTM